MIKMRNEIINRGRLYFGSANNLSPLSELTSTSSDSFGLPIVESSSPSIQSIKNAAKDHLIHIKQICQVMTKSKTIKTSK